MYEKLREFELDCLETVMDGQPLSWLGDGSARAASHARRVFADASRKLARGTAYYQMPEHSFECDYSLAWFKVHPKEGRALVERYQKAAAQYQAEVARAEKAFWSARGGVAKAEDNSDRLHD